MKNINFNRFKGRLSFTYLSYIEEADCNLIFLELEMYYLSTRGQAGSALFSDILIEGLASDGGLYVPKRWPKINKKELESWRRLSYADLAAEVLFKLAPEIPKERLLGITRVAYSSEVFSHVRRDSQASKIFPLRKLDDDRFLMELSNGPTLAFKDAAMQFLARAMSSILEQREEAITILGATSGDTGSAAIHAFRGREAIKVVMLSPDGRMSPFQRAQMYAVFDENILNVAVKGGFDECQDLVKEIKGDHAYKEKHRIGTANSINFGRIAAQCCYYVYAYLQVAEEIGDDVSFSVPTGNFGNAYAGLVARMMGVPIKRIIVTTNENDVLHRAMTYGVYKPDEHSLTTSSPSMDITKASNFERIVFEATGRKPKVVREMWSRLRMEGKIDFKNDYPKTWKRLKNIGLATASNDHQGRIKLMQGAKRKWDLVIDPHTADGMHGAISMAEAGETMVVLETAQPAKFAATIKEAIGEAPEMPRGFGDILSLPQKYERISDDVTELKSVIDKWAEKL